MKPVDLVFAIDCTGSMGPYIKEARENIKHISDEIVRAEKVNLHLALVEYRDHPPQDSTFVTHVLDFTESSEDMKTRLDECTATGGGDTPEAIADAMQALLKLSWRRDSTKVCIFIADSPPHAIGCSGDGFPEACPCGLDPMTTIFEIAEKAITMYMVGCEPSIAQYRDWFIAMADITGGRYVPLTVAKFLSKIIISGTLEEISLSALLRDATTEVVKLSTVGRPVSEEKLKEAVYNSLKLSGTKTKHLTSSSGPLPGVTKRALEIRSMKSMAEVREVFSRTPSESDTEFTVPPPDAEISTAEADISREQSDRLVNKCLSSLKGAGSMPFGSATSLGSSRFIKK
jgi:Mg-chelatase subunit ChlD